MAAHRHNPPEPPPNEVRIPLAVQPGTLAHAVLCHLVEQPTEFSLPLATELRVTVRDVHQALGVLRWNGLVDGTFGERRVTTKGLDLVRATVKGARV